VPPDLIEDNRKRAVSTQRLQCTQSNTRQRH